MEHNLKICQSCGMPLDQDPGKGGTNADKSLSEDYCSFCYSDGRFLDEGITLREKIEKNIRIAVEKMNIPESRARQMAESLLPTLGRWKNSK
jgi:hypothetical protein